MQIINLVPKNPRNSSTCERNINKYNRKILQKEPMFVKFHSPDCPHCVAMKKSWSDVPKTMRKMGINTDKLNLASVDSEVIDHDEIEGWNDIIGVPTIAKLTGDKVKVFKDDPTDTIKIIHFIVEEYSPKDIKKYNRFVGGGTRKRVNKKNKKTRRR